LRIVLDTNVFVSGILFGGHPNRIIKAWGSGKIDLVISPAILDEYVRVAEDLARRKGVDISPFIQMVGIRSTIWNAPRFCDSVCSDSDDDKFLECAVFSQTKIIVTGDRALLATSGFKGISVIAPAVFVKKYLGP
jgi:putative PIN family toxin of toxin-antitoxin system